MTDDHKLNVDPDMHSFMYDFSFGSLVIASEMACTRRDSHVGASAAVADAASARHTSDGTALMQARSQPPASRAEARPESDNISCRIILMCWRCAAGDRRNDQRNRINARGASLFTLLFDSSTPGALPLALPMSALCAMGTGRGTPLAYAGAIPRLHRMLNDARGEHSCKKGL